MSWKDIIKEDLTEKVIEALIPFYGSREEVIDSNVMGVMYEEDLKDMPPFTKDDVKSLIKDMQFTATSGDDLERKEYQKTMTELKKLL
tara:strand:- start:48 stop:311 length:264 start_codon:yes stop_codon:yes gene_type:complete